MATIKDVARLAGVSSRHRFPRHITHPKPAKLPGLLCIVHGVLSYHPNANARALAQQTTETIGLVG